VYERRGLAARVESCVLRAKYEKVDHTHQFLVASLLWARESYSRRVDGFGPLPPGKSLRSAAGAGGGGHTSPEHIMSCLFGPFQVRVDPWEVDYGPDTPLEPLADEGGKAVTVDVDVERRGDQWDHLTPTAPRPPERLYFIDGVRRLETRLVVRHNGRFLYGGFGSFAVGCVEARPGQAAFGTVDLGRQVVLGSDQRLPKDIPVHDDLVYRAESTKEEGPDAPLRTSQANMRSAEARLWVTCRSLTNESCPMPSGCRG
jgi:hypothetical protein